MADPDDICFLTEKELIWSGMLADVLKQNNIPFIQKSVMGAGLAMRAGQMLESVKFYVACKDFDAAQEIVEELFPSDYVDEEETIEEDEEDYQG